MPASGRWARSETRTWTSPASSARRRSVSGVNAERRARPPSPKRASGEGLGVDLAVAKPVGGGPEVVGDQGEPASRAQQRGPMRQQDVPDLRGAVVFQHVGRDDFRDAPGPCRDRIERRGHVGLRAVRSDAQIARPRHGRIAQEQPGSFRNLECFGGIRHAQTVRGRSGRHPFDASLDPEARRFGAGFPGTPDRHALLRAALPAPSSDCFSASVRSESRSTIMRSTRA